MVDELRKIGFANMADYMKPTPEAGPSLDFSDLTRDQTAARMRTMTLEQTASLRADVIKLNPPIAYNPPWRG